MNADQLMGLLRALLAASGPLAALLIQVYGIEEAKARAWLDIASAVLVILTPALTAWWSGRVHSDGAKVAAASTVPGVRVVVDSTAAPQAAVDVAKDPRRPRVTTSALALLAVGALLLGAGGLTACTSTGAPDQARINRALDQVQLAYSGAVTAVALYCAVRPDRPPCDSAEALNAIAAAKATLDVAIARARTTIAAATDADAVTLGLRIALDAVAVYAEAVRRFGVPAA